MAGGNLHLVIPESPEDPFKLKIDGEKLKKFAKLDVAEVNKEISEFLLNFELRLVDPYKTTKGIRVLGDGVNKAMKKQNAKRQEALRRKWHFVSIQNNLENLVKEKSVRVQKVVYLFIQKTKITNI